MANLNNWQELKTKVFPALEPTAKDNTVAKDWLNLKEVVKIELASDSHPTFRTFGTISKEQLTNWGIDETTLFAQAETNLQTRTTDYITLYHLEDFAENGEQTQPFCIAHTPENLHIPSKTETSDILPPAIVVTRATQCFGANVLLQETILYKIYEKIGEMYILGSSKHEIILLQADKTNADQSKELQMMTQSVNENTAVVDPNSDFLSNDIYYYDGKEVRIVS